MPRDRVVEDGDDLVLVPDGIHFETATADPPEQVEVDPELIEGTQPSQRTTMTKPEDVSWEEWSRRGDAVRTIAREFDEVDHGDIREFLTGRTTRELSDEEVGQIQHDVVAHRVRDIADILDEQLRSSSDRLKRARRTVRVQAPRGWLKKAFNSLDERAVGQVAARLMQRGFDADTVKAKVVSRVKDEETRNRLEESIDNQELKVEFADGFASGGIISKEDAVPIFISNDYIIPASQVDAIAQAVVDKLENPTEEEPHEEDQREAPEA